MELVTAADAGNVFFSGAFFQPKKYFAVRAAEVFVFFPVLQPFEELTDTGCDPGCQSDIFSVFRHPFRGVAGRHPEYGDDIENQADPAENNQTAKAAGEGENQAAEESTEAKIIDAVTALHEMGKGRFDPGQEVHSLFLLFLNTRRHGRSSS